MKYFDCPKWSKKPPPICRTTPERWEISQIYQRTCNLSDFLARRGQIENNKASYNLQVYKSTSNHWSHTFAALLDIIRSRGRFQLCAIKTNRITNGRQSWQALLTLTAINRKNTRPSKELNERKLDRLLEFNFLLCNYSSPIRLKQFDNSQTF